MNFLRVVRCTFCVAVAFASVSHISKATPQPSSIPQVKTVISPRVEALRLGEAAPDFSLPRLALRSLSSSQTVAPTSQNSQLQPIWHSRDSLGWHSLALLMVGQNFSASQVASLQETATQFQARNVDFVAVVPASSRRAACASKCILSRIPQRKDCATRPPNTIKWELKW